MANIILDSLKVNNISSFLSNEESVSVNPLRLMSNNNRAFIGSYVLGKGFLLEKSQAVGLMNANPKNKDVIKPILNGDDLNTDPNQMPSRFVIDFKNNELAYCIDHYPECYRIVLDLVKPERDKVNRESRRKKWWQFAEIAPNLYKAIGSNEFCFVTALTGKNLAFKRSETNLVFSHATGVINSLVLPRI